MADKQNTTDKTAASTSQDKAVVEEKKEEVKKLPQLGALEDDDEFEDFPADAAQAGTAADALKNAGAGDHLWEADWDDDDVEDDFTKQLRTAIAERNGGDDAMM